MQLMGWSSLITLPRLPPSERQSFATPVPRPAARVGTAPALAGFGGLPPALVETPPGELHPHRLRTALSRSHIREALLISLATLEALYLLAATFGFV